LSNLYPSTCLTCDALPGSIVIRINQVCKPPPGKVYRTRVVGAYLGNS